MKKMILLLCMLILMGSTSCTEWAAVLMGSGSFVASQNMYSKTYSGTNVITIIKTKKDIKTHAKEKGLWIPKKGANDYFGRQ